MTPKREPRPSVLGKRLMFTLLAIIAVVVVGVLYAYGIKDPAKGPGNLPPGGATAPHSESGLPASK